jgi:tetratricopeptide (TPR) repeat protein
LTLAQTGPRSQIVKRVVRFIAIVGVLSGCLHAESPKPNAADASKTGANQLSAARTEAPLPVPPEVMDLVKEARKEFERSNFADAEKCYDKALAKAPNNPYLLSNKGVVLLSQQKYQLAEETLQKAVAIAPEDDFAHLTLGIVEYQQGKFDEAIDELAKVLAINPKSAAAHNYLGIAASEKGWHSAAQKELETAISIDPAYADAHFNLTIVLTKLTPQNKQAARDHYKRAMELGRQADAALEALIK